MDGEIKMDRINEYEGNMYHGEEISPNQICAINIGACVGNTGNCGVFLGSCGANNKGCWIDSSICQIN